MTTSEITTTVLVADDGYKLTQTADVDASDRCFWAKVYLAVNDSADNYTEWTEEAAEAFIAEREAAETETEATDDTE